MKYAGKGALNRGLLNSLFGRKVRRPDAECWELEGFVANTMSGCGWRLRYVDELLEFDREFDILPGKWKSWHENSDPEDGKWVVIEKQDGKAVWTWFHKDLQVGAWVGITEPCPVTKTLVPTKNGYFKTVPKE